MKIRSNSKDIYKILTISYTIKVIILLIFLMLGQSFIPHLLDYPPVPDDVLVSYTNKKINGKCDTHLNKCLIDREVEILNYYNNKNFVLNYIEYYNDINNTDFEIILKETLIKYPLYHLNYPLWYYGEDKYRGFIDINDINVIEKCDINKLCQIPLHFNLWYISAYIGNIIVELIFTIFISLSLFIIDIMLLQCCKKRKRRKKKELINESIYYYFFCHV